MIQKGVTRRPPGSRRPPSVSALPEGLPHRTADSAWEVLTPTAEVIRFAREALRREGLEAVGDATLLRHRAGDRGLPPPGGAAACRFALDLSDGRSSVQGGVLLFIDQGGRAFGWRAEAGALTVWSGADPQLTELAPGAPDRLTLLGQARNAD